jgi:hypothetical protein
MFILLFPLGSGPPKMFGFTAESLAMLFDIVFNPALQALFCVSGGANGFGTVIRVESKRVEHLLRVAVLDCSEGSPRSFLDAVK